MATITAVAGGGNWNSTGTWDTASVPTSGDDVVLNASSGNVTINAAAACRSINCTGYTGTLTHNASITLTVAGQDGSGNSLLFVAGMTYSFTAASSRIDFTGAGTSKITCGGQTLPNVTFNNAGDTFQLQDTLAIGGTADPTLRVIAGTLDTNGQAVNFTGQKPIIRCDAATTFYNLTKTGTATVNDELKIINGSNITVSNTLSLNGNSSTKRLLVYNSSLGSSVTLDVTGATVSGCSNVDFRDIAFVGSPDFSAITGGSGDCGGNSGATFTTADDWYWNGSGTRNFSDYTYWYTATNGGGSQMASTRCPLPQDTCYFDADSIDGATTVDLDMPRVCKTLDFTGVDAMNFHMNNNIASTWYGSLTLVANVTVTGGNGSSFTFEGRDSYTITRAGSNWDGNNVYFNCVGGTYTLQDTWGSSYRIYAYYGTVDTNEQSLTTTFFWYGDGKTHTIDISNSSITLTGTSDVWYASSTTGLTFTTTGSTITLSDSSTSTKSFHGRGITYNNLTIAGGGTGIVQIIYSNTFNTFTINAPKTVKFTDGTTQTVSSFVAVGTDGNEITLTGTSTGGWTISDTTGTNSVEYCDISYSTATGGATWNAYTTNGCTDSGNNSGWVFDGGGPTGGTLAILTCNKGFWGA